MTNAARGTGFWRSPAVKLFAIGCLVLLLTIPLLMLFALLSERQSRAAAVEAEVGDSWGGAQRLSGPFLVIPYRVKERVSEGNDQTQRDVTVLRHAVFLPEALAFAGKANTDVLRRSIFDVTIYRAELTLTGTFAPPSLEQLVPAEAEILWDDAFVALAVSDVRAFRQSVALTLSTSERPIPFEPSVGLASEAIPGIHVRIGAAPARQGFGFSLPLLLNGSGSLMLAPAGRETRVALSSDWPHPSFFGAFLPDMREITTAGFKAEWIVPHLARSVPQSFVLPDYSFVSLDTAAFGVRFYDPINHYQLVDRALKFAVLFVVFVFIVAFLMELLSGRRVHLVQYFFIGLAQVVFYLLILSLAEHLGFERAYGAAAAATILLIAIYGAFALGVLRGILLLFVLCLVYGLLYLLLRLEDYALLAGSLAVFLLLAITMFATRRVDWSGASPPMTEGRAKGGQDG